MCDNELFEKVCKGLEVHIKPNSRCVGCPYPNNGLCGDQLYSDALAMIRQQQARIAELEAAQTAKAEPKTVQAIGYLGVSFDRFGKCPWCSKRIRDYESEHYCGHCGKAVKWDETD